MYICTIYIYIYIYIYTALCLTILLEFLGVVRFSLVLQPKVPEKT